MNKFAIFLIAVIVVLLILIVVFNDFNSQQYVSNYSDIETQMRKLWY